MANEVSSCNQPTNGPRIATFAIGAPQHAERLATRQRSASPAGEEWQACENHAARDVPRTRRISGTVEFPAKPQLGDLKPKVQGRLPPSRSAPSALFFSTLAPYIGGAGSPAMEINGRRNKPFGPGGSTRRLHPSPLPMQRVSAGAKQDRRGRKGRVFSRYGSAVIGLCNSCKRQLCSGCSGCVTQFERPSLKSWWVKLRQAGFGGTWQQKPPLYSFISG